MSGSSLANIRRTHTTELEEFFCRVLEEALNSHPDLLSLAVALPSKRGVEQHSGAAAFCKGSPGSSSWWREAAPSAQCRARRRIPAPSSSMWNLQLAANGVFFCWLCHTQFPKEEAGKLSLICMSFTSLSLAENTLCCSMDSSFLIHCSNYVLQPEYGTYVKADG